MELFLHSQLFLQHNICLHATMSSMIIMNQISETVNHPIKRFLYKSRLLFPAATPTKMGYAPHLGSTTGLTLWTGHR